MSYPYVCTTCRLRIILRKQSQIVNQPRQWLSRTTRLAQDPIDRVLSPRSLVNGLDRPQQSARSEADVPRGRYSGRPLAPEHLLDQLSEPTNTSKGSAKRPSFGTSGVPRPSKKTDNRLPEEKAQRKDGPDLQRLFSIPPDLWQDYQAFCHASKPWHEADSDDMKVLEILQKIYRNYRNTAGLDALARVSTFRKRCYWFMIRVRDNWVKAITTGEPVERRGPTPLETLTTVTTFNILNNSCYPVILCPIAMTIAELWTKQAEESRQNLLEAIVQLMGLWNLCMRIQSARSNNIGLDISKAADMDWSFLPNSDTTAKTLEAELQTRGVGRSSFEQALNTLVPDAILRPEQVRTLEVDGSEVYDYSSAAMVTLDLLQQLKAELHGEQLVKGFEPWMNLIRTMFRSLNDNTIPHGLAQKLKTSDMPEYYRGLVERLGLQEAKIEMSGQSLSENAFKHNTSVAKGISPGLDADGLQYESELLPADLEQTNIDKSNPTYRFVGKCIKRLGRATEQQDLTAAQRVYEEVKEFASRNPDTQLPMELYEILFHSFLSLRSPKITAAIWNDMIKAGLKPRGKTYTILMRGCHNARDHDAMEGFWRKMRQSGMQPDRHAWATRIFGLLRSRIHEDVGLKALQEMGEEWFAAARMAYTKKSLSKGRKPEKEKTQIQRSQLLASFQGDVDGVPRPNVVIMNSAISALAARNDAQIQKVLTWGRSFGIEPDLTTYNALINISMRHGLPEEALNILRRMREKGVEANSTTWTVLLTAMFESGALDGLDDEGKAERILDFVKTINNIEGSNLDEKGYALIVDRMLKVHDSPSVAQKIMEHMAAKGIKPNAHMYTIIMSAYFQQSPPDFAAVESLWAHMQSENAGYGAVLDSTFYDRMIEAYAAHHTTVGIRPMLYFLERMEAQGKNPSWPALASVARALTDAEEWQRLTQLVEKARRQRLDEPKDKKGFGQRNFWQFVRSIGMRVTEVEQTELPSNAPREHRLSTAGS